MIQFILGAVAGGLAAWWWRRDIQSYVDETLPSVREKTANRLAALENRAEEALGRARQQIDRMRSTTEERPHERSTSRPSGSFTQGTGV
jgi:low affinity Fe/Cu permease